jgi:succinate dehydrogenase/fumarate reductase flavoprotein subunit
MAGIKRDTAAESPGLIEWQYPVKYGLENEVTADVLVLGGGLAGCSAAISAAKKGLKVVLVDKGCVSHSGSGGAGIDHWHDAITNPCCPLTPEEYAQKTSACHGGYKGGIDHYISCRESYDTLLELEKLGMKIRDDDDEFKNVPFKDENTKFIFSYDYRNRYCITIWGTGLKAALKKGCRDTGVKTFERVSIQSLLTEGGKQGGRVIGATGFNMRTGEFYIFKAKATIICTGGESRLWYFSSEHRSLYSGARPGQLVGEGWVAAWKAGAEFTLLEKSTSMRFGGLIGVDTAHYLSGFWEGEWRPCTMVDANGKEIPWVDRDGNPVPHVLDRSIPSPGQKFFLPNLFVLPNGVSSSAIRECEEPHQIRGLREVIEKGEFVTPFYADLSSMPDQERKAVFGLHIAQEGKTMIGYRMLTEAGFDPDKHMLQYYPVDVLPRARQMFFNCGGLVPDWDLRTNLEGLFVAGQALLTGGEAAHACATGGYAGRKAAEYAKVAAEPVVHRNQVVEEKVRVYAPVYRKGGIDWKQLNIGISQIMQVYCGDVRNEESLKIGLKWLDELNKQEANEVCARNPHELARTMEALSLITLGEMVMHASLARKASSAWLDFRRSDYPAMDPPEWHKFITLKLEDDTLIIGELPTDYCGDLKENYEVHCGL